MKLAILDVTDAQIDALRLEALQASDYATADICELAMGIVRCLRRWPWDDSAAARGMCVAAISNARAQAGEP